MRSFWILAERLDKTVFSLLDKVDEKRGKEEFRARVETAVEHVRKPQHVIQFDN